MRRTDPTDPIKRRGEISKALAALLAGILLLNPSNATARPSAEEICTNTMVREKVAELVGTWAQNYPFSRVLVGKYAWLGRTGEPHVYTQDRNSVTCLTSYQLPRPNERGGGYVVTIDHLNFRVFFENDETWVELIDLPASLDGTNLTMPDLIARFSIGGRPYADILKENQKRLNGVDP